MTLRGWRDSFFTKINSRCRKCIGKGSEIFEHEVVSLLKKDSTEITDQDPLLLKNFIKDCPHECIVITHGSDTLIETAQFVGNILDKTTVFTWAFLPEMFKESDADFNIGMALGAAMSLESGTFIAINC